MSEQKKVCECGDVDCLKGSQSFTEASAARTAPAEPVGVVNAVENKGSTRWDGVIYASAILEGHVKHGTKLYTAPDALQAENERLREEVERLRDDNEALKGLYKMNAAYETREMQGLRSVVEDLSALVCRLVQHLRKALPDNGISEKALDYLKRKGLLGRPYRGDDSANDGARTAKPEVKS